MRSVRLALALLAATTATLGVVAINAPAYGLSCIDAASVAESSDSVFTGTIADARDGRILVHVEEIWKGDPVGSEVWLALDPELEGWWDELPEHDFPDGYSSTRPWVFAPRVEKGVLQVNTCTAGILSGPWRFDLERPATVSRPVVGTATEPVSAPALTPAAERDGGSAAVLIAGTTTTALVAGAVAYSLMRRRSRSR